MVDLNLAPTRPKCCRKKKKKLWAGCFLRKTRVFSWSLKAETTFDLWPLPWGGGAWGAGTNMWHPETPASCESLPAPLATHIPTLWIHAWGGGGSDIRSMSSMRPISKCRCPPLLESHLWRSKKKRSITTLEKIIFIFCQIKKFGPGPTTLEKTYLWQKI